MNFSIPKQFLSAPINSTKAVNEIVAHYKNNNEPMNSCLILALLILIKTRKLRHYFINAIKRPDLITQALDAQKRRIESRRHHLWNMLRIRGIESYEFGSEITHILHNSTTYIVCRRSCWVIVSENRLKDFDWWYKVKNINGKFTITRIEGPKKKKKSKVHVKKTRKKDARSPYTVYSTPARIIYTPMGGQGKRR